MNSTAIKVSNRYDYKTSATMRAQKTAKVSSKIFIYVFLAFFAIIILIPFYWMLNVSFEATSEVLSVLTPNLFPRIFSPENYVNAFMFGTGETNDITFITYFYNTVIVASFTTVIGTIFAIITAFALGRLNFKGKNLLFTLLLATMMIPSEMFLITNMQTISTFRWREAENIGSYLAMIIPFTVSVFHVFLLRQSFRQVPNELYYAAKVDGCGDWKYLWTVMVPMAKSSIITIVILRVMGAWNAFMWPQIAAHERFRLLTSWLRSGFREPYVHEPRTLINLQMAATVTVTVPLLILFVFARKYIMTGISRSGVKG